MAKIIYTMGETARLLGENTSAIRYWSNYFSSFVKPSRNAKGNRLFSPDDVETLRQIQFLLKKQGMTLEGALQKMKDDRHAVSSRLKALDSLKEIRSQLVEVRKSL